MSTQMWSSFPDTSHLFMSYLVLLPFPCDLLALISRQIKRFHSPLLSCRDNFCLYNSQPLLSLPIHPRGPRPRAPPELRQCPLSSFFLSSLGCLPLKPASPPVLMSCSLLPQRSSNLPMAPQQIWALPPTSVLFLSQSSSLLSSLMGFALFLLLLRALLCPIPSSVLCLSPAFRAACCLPCQAQPGLLLKGSLSLFSCTPGLSRRRHRSHLPGALTGAQLWQWQVWQQSVSF